MGVAAVGRSASRRDMGVVGGIRASREGNGRKGEYMGARDRTLAHSYTARGRKEEYIYMRAGESIYRAHGGA